MHLLFWGFGGWSGALWKLAQAWNCSNLYSPLLQSPWSSWQRDTGLSQQCFLPPLMHCLSPVTCFPAVSALCLGLLGTGSVMEGVSGHGDFFGGRRGSVWPLWCDYACTKCLQHSFEFTSLGICDKAIVIPCGRNSRLLMCQLLNFL